MFVPHRKQTYEPPRSVTGIVYFLYVDDDRTSQETHIDLHGLLLGVALLFIYRWCSYLSGNTPINVYGLLWGQL
jgi:hypothetical protein